jgi:hypothetical protein
MFSTSQAAPGKAVEARRWQPRLLSIVVRQALVVEAFRSGWANDDVREWRALIVAHIRARGNKQQIFGSV